jgi:hypothetical protein
LHVRKLIGYNLTSSGLFDRFFKNYRISDFWKERISTVVKSPDNEYIKRVENAGQIIGGKQIMHNGLKIHLGSYYGPEVARMLLANKGVHEPQEERVFSEILPLIPDGGLMIELGAFWSFYSMWFNKEIKNARNFMVEGDAYNLGCGKRNFKLNKMEGTFIHANIGENDNSQVAPIQLCIDTFVKDNRIPYIDILHSDIQGYELDMLKGAKKTFENHKIGFVFISTHSQDLHERCKATLLDFGYELIADADIQETYSEDGLIVARSPVKIATPISISKRL